MRKQGKLDEAIACYRWAVQLKPDFAEVHNNLGVTLKDQGKLDEAVACYRRVVQLRPNDVEPHNNLGVALKDQGKPDEAVACYRRALQLNPDDVEVYNNLGDALKDQGKLDELLACYRRAVQLRPNDVEPHNKLGNALKNQGKLDEAITCYRRALELRPDYAEIHNNLGNALKDQGKLDEAVACYRRALELKPDSAEAHNNLGAAFKHQGQLDEAVACYRRALELKPDFAEAHNNLGVALKKQGKSDEAIACYRHALELKPDYADAHCNQSLISLAAGDFEHGWAEYEWRWKTNRFQQRDFSQSLWDGQPLEGRAILLHAEQGLGDAIQFVRYAALVQQRGGTVIVECPRPLLSLLRSCAGIDRLVERGEELPTFNLQAPLLSLPGIFHTVLETIPADVPYLYANQGLMEHWREELGRIAGFKIGIVWQGTSIDPARIIPLSCFESLAGLPGVRFFSLQKGRGVEQLQDLAGRFPVTEVGSRLDNFMDTAAVLVNLDLVISCDTAVAHLAGALAVPVCVALPFVPDWRWLLNRSDSPWYPTMRLFRQKKPGDWAGVFEEIKAELCVQLQSKE
jgi:tetratricopeptide (TPR) repeat protein